MMKRFKNLSLVLLSFGVVHAPNAMALTNSNFASDSARDMLRGSEGETENENADSASQWGSNGNKVRSAKITVAKPIDAIDESSFASENNRAPASMREPAAVKTAAKKKPLPSAKTMVRTLQQKKAYQEAAVIVNDLGFFPSTLFVTQGIPVRLFVTGASQRSQCMILDAFGVRRQIRSNKVEEVTFTPDQIGKFAFTCPMNGARGTIIVKELDLGQSRLPASEVQSAMAEPKEEKQDSDEDSAIHDSDFGVEFRVKP